MFRGLRKELFIVWENQNFHPFYNKKTIMLYDYYAAGDFMDAQQPPAGEGNVPPEGPPPQYTPPPSDYPGQYGRPKRDLSKSFTTDNIVKMMALGILLMFLGAMFMALVSTGGPNTFDDKYDKDDDGSVDFDRREDYFDDMRLYETLNDIGTVLGKILMYFGILMLTIALFGGGIVNKDMDKFVRLGMILAAGFVISWSALA
jgi:hypothetical protein